MTAATVILALAVGCVLAFEAYWVWRLHLQVTELQAQVARLRP